MVTTKITFGKIPKHSATECTATSDARFSVPQDPKLSKITRFTLFPSMEYTMSTATKCPVLPVTNIQCTRQIFRPNKAPLRMGGEDGETQQKI